MSETGKVKTAASMAATIWGLLGVLALSGCSALFPRKMTLNERLAQFPGGPLPVSMPVTIYWNEQQIPYIHAQTDSDLAFTLGLVHAHLRGAQLAILKRVAAGRIAEMGGPLATDIDEALRILGFGRGAATILAQMDPSARAWLERFVEGLNYYHAHSNQRPPEFALLGIEHEPYTPEDILTFGRLAGTDVNWLSFFSLLRERSNPHWEEVWARTLQTGLRSPASFSPQPTDLARLEELLAGFSRSGSNSVVVAGHKTASGSALIANDPHLGMTLPNLWLICGVQSPGYNWVGMMVPGLPFCALGRNPHMAWGGTNMRSASSDFYDVSGFPSESFQTETHRLKVRFWRDKTITARLSPMGPVLSDATVVPAAEGEMLALRWVGHQPSDEIAAFLKANQARNPAEFRAAFNNYAVSGQNLLFADTEGSIGMILAARMPVRSYDSPPTLILDGQNPAHQWRGFLNSTDLPWMLNPQEGFIASANNNPIDAGLRMNFFFGEPERIERLQQLLRDALANGGLIDAEFLHRLQLDVYSPAAHRLAGEWIAMADEAASDLAPALLGTLRQWDGHYRAGDQGPVAFETLTYHLSSLFLEKHKIRSPYFENWNYTSEYLAHDLRALPPESRSTLIRSALSQAAKDFERFPSWGHMHRLQARSLLAGIPLLGKRFVFSDFPASGSRETIQKTAHSLQRDKAGTRYGQQSRHISDLSDPDANDFILFGGQDGWLGSENFDDQVGMMRRGEKIRVPLQLETVRAQFPHQMHLQPASPPPSG